MALLVNFVMAKEPFTLSRFESCGPSYCIYLVLKKWCVAFAFILKTPFPGLRDRPLLCTESLLPRDLSFDNRFYARSTFWTLNPWVLKLFWLLSAYLMYYCLCWLSSYLMSALISCLALFCSPRDLNSISFAYKLFNSKFSTIISVGSTT